MGFPNKLFPQKSPAEKLDNLTIYCCIMLRAVISSKKNSKTIAKQYHFNSVFRSAIKPGRRIENDKRMDDLRTKTVLDVIYLKINDH